MKRLIRVTVLLTMPDIFRLPSSYGSITTQILNYNTKSLDINVIKTITTTLAEAKLNIIEASETF